MTTEAQRRANRKYRAANLEKCRETSRLANQKRYHSDENYRQYCIQKASIKQPGLNYTNLQISQPLKDELQI